MDNHQEGVGHELLAFFLKTQTYLRVIIREPVGGPSDTTVYVPLQYFANWYH